MVVTFHSLSPKLPKLPNDLNDLSDLKVLNDPKVLTKKM